MRGHAAIVLSLCGRHRGDRAGAVHLPEQGAERPAAGEGQVRVLRMVQGAVGLRPMAPPTTRPPPSPRRSEERGRRRDRRRQCSARGSVRSAARSRRQSRQGRGDRRRDRRAPRRRERRRTRTRQASRDTATGSGGSPSYAAKRGQYNRAFADLHGRPGIHRKVRVGGPLVQRLLFLLRSCRWRRALGRRPGGEGVARLRARRRVRLLRVGVYGGHLGGGGRPRSGPDRLRRSR